LDDDDDYSDLSGIASFGDGSDAFGEDTEDTADSTDELGTMLIGNQTDDDADQALEAMSNGKSNGKGEEPVFVGLTDDDLDALLGEDF